MYLWDFHDLVENLKNDNIPLWKVRIYYILSPLFSILNGLFFGSLLISHHIVEYYFQSRLPRQHADIQFYNYWALTIAFLTVIIAFGGIYLCYRTNRQGDNKNFWQRMACLSFPINFNLTVYAIAFLSVVVFLFYLLLQSKITTFTNSLWSIDETINTALQKTTGNNPLVNVTIQEIKKKPGILGTILKAPIALAAAPFIPMRIKRFITELRAIILMGYPALSLIPPLLSLIHYLILRRMIKKVSQKKELVIFR